MIEHIGTKSATSIDSISSNVIALPSIVAILAASCAAIRIVFSDHAAIKSRVSIFRNAAKRPLGNTISFAIVTAAP